MDNASDACPLSLPGRAVDVDGCTGAEGIALACNPDDFTRHGRYVRCVAHAAKAAVEAGLISWQEAVQLVNEAAKF